MPRIDEERKAVLDKLFAKGELFTTVDSTETAPNLEPIWGNWLFKQSIVEEVGEPGISKTTFNYAFVNALLNHQPFLSVNGRLPTAMKVLYLDLESSDSLIKSRKNMLGCIPNPNFVKCNLPNVILSELESYIDDTIKREGNFHLIFVDPIRMAFNTRDENDNAEASRQMKYVRYLVEKWKTTIILVHHSSKAELTGTRKGSGAFARPALADVVWNFEKLGEEFSPDLFKFYIPKSRLIQDDLCLCIKKEECGFKEVSFPIGYKVSGAGIRIYSLQQAIDVLMRDMKQRTPHEILEELKTLKVEVTRVGLHKALVALMQLGAIKRADYGKYIYIPSEV